MDLQTAQTIVDLIEENHSLTPALSQAILGVLTDLAHLYDRVAALEEANPEANLPEECRKHECTYYTHYLMYGPKELEHEGYHAAEKQCEKWQTKVADWFALHINDPYPGPACPWERQATYWEKVVRA